MNRTVWYGLALAAVVVLGALSVALAQTTAADNSVAVVNGEKISLDTFVNTLEARYGTRVLNSLISNAAIRQAAKAAGVAVTQDELEARYLATQRIVEMRAPVTGENFVMWLAKQSLTPEYFRNELYDQMLIEKMVQKQVKVTNEDVSNFYQRNRDQLAEPRMVQVAHICVKTQQEAEAIRADIVGGKITWADAVKKYSLDPWTKDDAGDLGFMPKQDTDFHKAAFALSANGEISQPVTSPMGVHLIKRLAVRDARIPPFEEIEARIREQLEKRQLVQLASVKRDDILKVAKWQITAQIKPENAPPVAPATPAAAPK